MTLRNFAEGGQALALSNNARQDFSRPKFGAASLRLDAQAGSYAQSIDTFTLGTSDWCLEFWAELVAFQPNTVVRLAQLSTSLPNEYGPGHVSLRASGGLSLIVYDFDSSTPLISTTEAVIGVGWKHIAISREGSTWRLFVDGALAGTATWAGSIQGTNSWFIGGHPYTQTAPDGWIDDVRLTVGAARYTAGFTPPDAHPLTNSPFLMDYDFSNVELLLKMEGTAGSTTFTDSSSKNRTPDAANAVISDTTSKFGLASAQFNGSTRIRYNIALQQNTQQTYEAWAYITGLPSSGRRAIFGNDTSAMTIGVTSGGLLTTQASGSFQDGQTLPLNEWIHFAFEVNNNTFAIYVNGVQQIAGSPVVSRNTFDIGSTGGGAYFVGFIDEVRVTFGFRRYAQNFTPPTTEFWSGSLTSGGVGDPLFLNSKLIVPMDYVSMWTSNATLSRPLLLQTFTPDWPVKSKGDLPRPTNLNRYLFGGIGKISGTVKVSGTPDLPISRLVRLYHEASGVFVADTFSAEGTGEYEFLALDVAQRFSVVTYDYEKTYRAVIADNIVPIDGDIAAVVRVTANGSTRITASGLPRIAAGAV